MNEHSTQATWKWALQRLRKALEEGEAIGEAFWERLQEELIEWQHMTAPEARELTETLQQDWLAVRQAAGDLGGALRDWLHLGAQAVESYLEDWVALAADHAEVDWWFLQKKWKEAGRRRTGQQVTVGTYRCDNCGQRLSIHQPGKLPPCPKCHATRFTLWTAGDDEEPMA
jgi:DNA-directed RNA polymerase subunit RPC12/RpoP